jgi:hypothetical protein
MNRRLTITAVYANGIDLGFRVTTEVQNRLGYLDHPERRLCGYVFRCTRSRAWARIPSSLLYVRAEVR